MAKNESVNQLYVFDNICCSWKRGTKKDEASVCARNRICYYWGGNLEPLHEREEGQVVTIHWLDEGTMESWLVQYTWTNSNTQGLEKLKEKD